MSRVAFNVSSSFPCFFTKFKSASSRSLGVVSCQPVCPLYKFQKVSCYSSFSLNQRASANVGSKWTNRISSNYSKAVSLSFCSFSSSICFCNHRLLCTSRLRNLSGSAGCFSSYACFSSLASAGLQRSSSSLFSSSTSSAPRFHVCIVGSGPSGFYSAKYILKQIPCARVDMIEKLPAPFGLVRYGIAPDHPEIKVVTNDFDTVAKHHNFRFFGNVQLRDKSLIKQNAEEGRHQNSNEENVGTKGGDISLDELRQMYDAVILAYGAAEEKKLGIEGENLAGIISARQFVGWYNGHPDETLRIRHALESIAQCRKRKAETCNAIIIGNGNVALDVARVLSKSYDALKTTDITEEAAEWLRENLVKKVYVIGRRGWGQCAFTNKELRCVLDDETVLCVMHPHMYEKCLNDVTKVEIQNSRLRQRQQTMMQRMVSNWELQKSTNKKIIEFQFLLSPVKLIGDENGYVSSAVFTQNKLKGEALQQKAVPNQDAENVSLPTNLVVFSVGYAPVIIDDLPKENNKLVHEGGRIFSPTKLQNNKMQGGLYAVGWLKRGANGIIASNVVDARETVQHVVDDFDKFFSLGGNDKVSSSALDLGEYLRKKNVSYVTFNEWLKIKDEEISRGKPLGKIARKITDISEMLRVAKAV